MAYIKALIVCVDYSDYLSITLPINRPHFSEVLVITTPGDTKTQEVALENNSVVFMTESFYDDGAYFNKWKALEEGYDLMGRTGWLCNLDADVVWPVNADLSEIVKGNLYCPYRRMGPDSLPLRKDWEKWPIDRVTELAGYSQIFHADDPVLRDRPWMQQNWKHAGGADSFFQQRWKPENKKRFNWEVMHLGERGKNWCGRSTQYLSGDLPKNGAERLSKLREMLEERKRTRSFEHEKL